MIKLRIDNKEIEVPKGTTILKAALQAGIQIPTMCFSDESFIFPCIEKNLSTHSLHHYYICSFLFDVIIKTFSLPSLGFKPIDN